jgi:hypothetical protein
MSEEPKPKTFQLSKEQLSELSYVATQRTAAMEVTNFWDKRMDNFMKGVRMSLAIGDDYNVNWNDAFIDGKLTATKVVVPVPKKEEKHDDTKKV